MRFLSRKGKEEMKPRASFGQCIACRAHRGPAGPGCRGCVLVRQGVLRAAVTLWFSPRERSAPSRRETGSAPVWQQFSSWFARPWRDALPGGPCSGRSHSRPAMQAVAKVTEKAHSWLRIRGSLTGWQIHLLRDLIPEVKTLCFLKQQYWKQLEIAF